MRKIIWILFWGGLFLMAGELSLKAQEVPHYDHMVDMDDPQVCLTCHDGAIAQNVIPCPEKECAINSGFSHSVFRKYPPAGRESEFHPLSRVTGAGVRLKDGKVTCISCHDLSNQQKYHLVMENTRSQLCRTCHVM